MKKIEILDSTLRDGAQTRGISFALSDKVKIVKLLDELGIHIIEAGNPYSNPKDRELFKILAEEKLNSSLCVFGSTRKANSTVDTDAAVLETASISAPFASVVGKCWDYHVTEVLRTTLDENILMIYDTVKYLTKKGKKVIFDAEHYFNSFKENEAYALKTLEAAGEAGAYCLCLCDTNGTFLPDEIHTIMEKTMKQVQLPLGIHCHNDTGMAAASSIMAVKAGAVHVQGTMNGYGERCGNADLCTIMPNIKFKLGLDCIEDLSKLTYISNAVAETANLPLTPNAPYVGKNAFSHKAGMHSDAISKSTDTYEHINPDFVGNQRKILMSEVAGRSAVYSLINAIDPSLGKDADEVGEILGILKEREMEGYQYEGAEGSFEILVRKALGKYKPFFDLVSFKVVDEEGSSVAMVKIRVDDMTEVTAAEGDGPVNAMDTAIRKALGKFYPSLNEMKLTDYKVRVLDSGAATAASVRVLIESSDMNRNWTTIGVSANIIEASRKALVDSIEYKLMLDYQG